MRGTSIVICALAACGGKTAAPAHHAAPTAKLCVDPIAPGGTSIALERDDDPSRLESPRDLGEGRVAVAVVDAGVAITQNADCGQTPCSPEIVRLDADGKVLARAALPHVEDLQPSENPFGVAWLSVADVDGDGAPEAWVSYGITTPPAADVGSTTTEYVAMFTLPDLTVRFVAPHGVYPDADSFDRCDGTLALVDADCDGRQDLVIDQTCAPGVCHEDPEEEVCVNPAPPAATVYLRDAAGAYAAVTPGA